LPLNKRCMLPKNQSHMEFKTSRNSKDYERDMTLVFWMDHE
jgi:hypothetical protein